VDDERPILAATRDLLQDYGYEVEVHSDAAGIPERLRDVRPDVLLQDVRMPGLDVRELLGILRADPALRDTRVVLFSASLEAQELGQELSVPVLRKPFKPQALLAALRGE